MLVEASLEFQVQISGLKMKAEFIHIRSRSVTYLGRPPPPSFVSLNLDGPPPSPPPSSPPPTASPPPTSGPATEKEQQIIDQLRVMSQMLEDSARKDALVRQARRQDLADLRLKKE